MRKVLACVLLGVSIPTALAQSGAIPDAPISRIAFGSCYKTDRDEAVWATIESRRPDVTVLLGDNVYADTRNEAALRAAWEELATTPGFASLRANTTLLATWDDHDFGENDAGREYPIKVESQRAFLDFLGEPDESPRRAREGVYESYLFGPVGRRVQIILLDTRYHRAPLVKRAARGEYADGAHGWYTQDASGAASMLGDEQWRWLEETLQAPADLRFIGSSIQVVAEDHFWERWDEFPLERARLLRLVADQPTPVIFITGDRHKAEISLLDVERMDDAERVDVPAPLYDVTASSLNAPLGAFSNEINRHRLGRVYEAANFGEIVLDWDTPESPAVTMQIVDSSSGRVVIRRTVRLSDLAKR